jgi:predicted nucleotidyltransferase
MHLDAKILDDLVRRILEGVQPQRIILFGSAARGDMRPDSNIDILVVVPDGTPRSQTAQTIYRRLIGLHAAVDVVVATENDLQQYGDNFSLVYYPALREGRAIYAV